MIEKEKKSTFWTWIIVVTIVLAAIFGMIAALYQATSPEPALSKKITINHTETTMNSVGFWTADAGKTLLVVNMTIENHGYDEFYVNPLNFKAVVDSVVYSHSIITYFLDDVGYIPMQPVYVLDGGKLVCAISFEIPENYQSISLRHERAVQYNIEWVSAFT